jgi:hypothetical protein
VLDVPDRVARDVYGYDLILLRPDLHVVWRGKAPPEDAAEVAAIATGHSADRRPPQSYGTSETLATVT